MYVQRQVGEGKRRAVFFQESPKEGVVVSFACPNLKRRKMDAIMRAAGEYVCACLHCAFRAVGAEGFDVRKALPPIGIVFSNGSMPGKGPGDPGEFFGVVVHHVKEVVLGAFVFNHRLEGLPVASHIEPVSPVIGGEAGERLPMFVGLGHMFIKEVLP